MYSTASKRQSFFAALFSLCQPLERRNPLALRDQAPTMRSPPAANKGGLLDLLRRLDAEVLLP